MEKFQITVRDFEKSLMAKGSWLASYVPRAILAYQDKRVEARLSTLRRELMTATGEDQIRILDEIGKANTLKRRIKIKLGREK